MSDGTWIWGGQLYGYSVRNWNNDRMDALNAEYAVVIGANPAVSACGNQLYSALLPMKDAGVKFYFVDVMYNDSIAALGAEWIPIRPATDKALLLAIAHAMFTEDDPATNPIIDWDMLGRCAVGYDADHMPEGVDSKENFKDYALGTYDGLPKTPEWAEEITSVPADKIRELAGIMAKGNKVAFATGNGPARNNDSEALTQLHMIVGAMGGHMGKSGHMTGFGRAGFLFNEPKTIVRTGPWPLMELRNPVDDCIHQPFLWESLLAGHYNYNGIWGTQPPESSSQRQLNLGI